MPYYTRGEPFSASLKDRYLLSREGSNKKTYHLVLDIKGGDIEFKVGDSIGILVENDPRVVEKTTQALGATGEEVVHEKRTQTPIPLRQFLQTKANLSKISTKIVKLVEARHTHLKKQEKLRHLLQPEHKAELQETLQGHHIWDFLDLHKESSFSPEEIAIHLLPLMPRFYSIASSPKVCPDEIHLTVAFVSFHSFHQLREGVGSHYLCKHIEPQNRISIYVQPSNGFTLPEDPSTPIIMIGPGTGIAPFRGFLQERMEEKNPGKSWLFFGEQKRSYDFYYEDYFLDLEKQGKLRLDLAFSRDQSEKVYVQHLLLKQAEDIWQWIQDGANLYVCGDANQMAKDVEAAFLQIFKDLGNMNEIDAKVFLKDLRSKKKYLTDVY